MRVLFIADPVESLNPKTDTSLILAREFFSQHHPVWWVNASQLKWQSNHLVLEALPLEKPGSVDQLPDLGSPKVFGLEDFDLVMIRKEPPFDASFLTLCWLLCPYESKVKMVNRPSLLIRHHEKMLALEAAALGVIKPDQVMPTFLVHNQSAALEWMDSKPQDDFILKPWLGHGGRDVFRLSQAEFSRRAKSLFRQEPIWMLQEFNPEILTRGDRRLLYWRGELIGEFVRLPAKGDFLANLARGGEAVHLEMTAAEKELAVTLGQWLKELKIDFAGADFIGAKLSEVNITCPTGLQSVLELSGEDLAKSIVKSLTDSDENLSEG